MKIENRCGGCTVCCDILPVKWLNKPKNTKCLHCIINVGCNIQSTKEDECRDFDCSYVQSNKSNIQLRPDKCGIMFEKITDNIFYGTVVPDIKIKDVAKDQINSFQSQGYSVILYSFNESKPLIFLAENHIETEILQEFANHLNYIK